MKRNDRNNPSPGTSNGMMLAELKHLKATLAAKDKRIKELEDQLKAAKGERPAAPAGLEVLGGTPVAGKPAA